MLATKSGLKLFEAMQEASTVSYWAQFGNRWKVAQMVISMAIIKEKCWPGTCCSRGLCFRIDTRVFFIFVFFKKKYRNIFSISKFTVLYPYRPAGGGRKLHVNKYNFFARRPLAGACRPARPAGGRQAPPKYKS